MAELGLPIFLDLKLHDIPNTVAKAVQALRALEPAILTVHAAAAARCWRMPRRRRRPGTKVVAVTMLTSLDADDLAATGVGGNAHDQVAAADRTGARGRASTASSVRARRWRRRRRLWPKGFFVVPGVRPADGRGRRPEARRHPARRRSTPAPRSWSSAARSPRPRTRIAPRARSRRRSDPISVQRRRLPGTRGMPVPPRSAALHPRTLDAAIARRREPCRASSSSRPPRATSIRCRRGALAARAARATSARSACSSIPTTRCSTRAIAAARLDAIQLHKTTPARAAAIRARAGRGDLGRGRGEDARRSRRRAQPIAAPPTASSTTPRRPPARRCPAAWAAVRLGAARRLPPSAALGAVGRARRRQRRARRSRRTGAHAGRRLVGRGERARRQGRGQDRRLPARRSRRS